MVFIYNKHDPLCNRVRYLSYTTFFYLLVASLVCDYCSTGDLYTYWLMIGHFGEDALKVFAAELGSALGEYF